LIEGLDLHKPRSWIEEYAKEALIDWDYELANYIDEMSDEDRLIELVAVRLGLEK